MPVIAMYHYVKEIQLLITNCGGYGELCDRQKTDSDSVNLGSNPSSPANKINHLHQAGGFKAQYRLKKLPAVKVGRVCRTVGRKLVGRKWTGVGLRLLRRAAKEPQVEALFAKVLIALLLVLQLVAQAAKL